MSGYLARLALRALGHPVDTRLVPRRDPMSVIAHGIDADDAAGVEREIAPPVAPRSNGERRDRGATTAEPAAASVRRASLPEAAPAEHPHGAPVAASPPRSVRARVQLEAAAVDLPPTALPVVHAERTLRAGPPVSVPRDATPPAARARSSALASRETPARRIEGRNHIAGSVVDVATPPRAGEARDLRSNADFVPSTANPMLERPAPIDIPVSPRSPAPREVVGDASASVAPASISVEIGRIEVKIAPSPAPASRPRAAPEGFDGYWRLRNYLDRPR